MKQKVIFSLVPIIVILSYFLIVYPKLFARFSPKPQTHYQYLTAGFLAGQLNLSISPAKELLQLPNPYDPVQNETWRLHDATLYHGKYYLYFGVLPVLAFFLPIKYITQIYPSEPAAVLFFLSIGFIIGFGLLIKIHEKYFPHISTLQIMFIGLIFGFANNAPFLLSRPSFYEVAISSAFCFTTIALLFLYQFFHHAEKIRYAWLFSWFLSLAAMGRPHFMLVAVILIPSTFIYFWLHRSRSFHLILAFFVPLIIVATALATYNYLRFSSLLEFGQNYMLAGIDTTKTGLFNIPHLLENMLHGFTRYILQPFSWQETFPYVYFSKLSLLPLLANHYYEPTMGILLSTPLVFLALAFPSQLEFFIKNNYQKLYRLFAFLLCLGSIPIIIFLFLITLSGGTQRYETDFLPYLLLLSIVSFWLFEEYRLHPRTLAMIKLFFTLCGLFSIYVGMSLGVIR